MSWAKLDDGFWAHPKVLTAGLAAAGLQAKALAWSSQYLTDGRIPRAAALLLLGGEPVSLCARLVDAGLWHEDEGGWAIHDYLVYNPSKAQVLSERAASRERMEHVRANKRAGSGDVRPNTPRTAADRAAGVRPAFTLPDPDPDPEPEPGCAARTGAPALAHEGAHEAEPDATPGSGLPPIDAEDEDGERGPVAHLTASSADEEVGRQVLGLIAEAWGQENTWQACKRRLLAIVRAYPLEDIQAVVEWHARPATRRRVKNAPTVAWVFKDAETFENWRNQARADVPRNGHAHRPAEAPAPPPADPERQRRADLEAALAALAAADARWPEALADIQRDQRVSRKGAEAELQRRRRRQESYIEELGGTAPPAPELTVAA